MKRNKDVYFITDNKGDSVMINCYLKGSNKNVGYIIYEYFMKPPGIHDNLLLEEQTIILKFLEVHDNFKYNGFGSKLMEEFIKQFNKQNKVNNVILEARPFNSEIGLTSEILVLFYEKFGFNLVECNSDNYKIMQCQK